MNCKNGEWKITMKKEKVESEPILTVFFSTLLDRATQMGGVSGGAKIGLWDEISQIEGLLDDSM